MVENKSNELKQRREELTQSLSALGQKQADTYRANSDALALDRAGVKSQAPQEMARLGEAEVATDTAIRDVQRELRSLDTQIDDAPRSGSRLGRFVRRARGDS